MESIWAKAKVHGENNLLGNTERDIVVVGGGIAGYLTAYRLSESGKKVTLIEAKKLFGGVTRKTTAHIDCIEGFTYSEMAKKSLDNTKDFYNFQLEAIDEYEKLINKYNIDCDFVRVDSYTYSNEKTDKLIDEYNTLRDIGADVVFLEKPVLAVSEAVAAFKLKNQAIFDPIKFLNGLPVKFDIIEDTKVISVDFKKNILYTELEKITANKIVIATNFPIIDCPGWYFLRMYKSHSYAIAINKAQDIKGSYQNFDESGLTFRNHIGNLIVGGYDHRTGRPYKYDNYERLYDKGKHLTDFGECTHTWSSNDCITNDYLPYVGYYSKCSKDIFVISGFNKLGMAKAMASSMLITDMINNVDNKYKNLCSPQRKGQCNKDFFKNLLCTVKNLLIMPFIPPFKCSKSLKKGEGAIVFYKGVKKAVYRDTEGDVHVCSAYCAHLGCQLHFNPDAKSWDCPCHGSRFDVDGNIITAPTVKELNE